MAEPAARLGRFSQNRRGVATEKDASDLELALSLPEVIAAPAVTVFGATGGRTDHLLGNLQLLGRNPERVIFENEHEWIFALRYDATLSVRPGQQVSLMPLFGPVTGVTTEGLKWEMRDSTLDANMFSLSNLAKGNQVHVHHKTGLLLCIISK